MSPGYVPTAEMSSKPLAVSGIVTLNVLFSVSTMSIADANSSFKPTKVVKTDCESNADTFSSINPPAVNIASIEITYSNSLIQNIIMTGPILREYLLLCCRDRSKVNTTSPT